MNLEGAVEHTGTREEATSQFSRLLAEHWPRAYRFAYRLCGDTDQAEEVLQQAAEEALRAFHRFRPGTRFDRWFLRIVYHPSWMLTAACGDSPCPPWTSSPLLPWWRGAGPIRRRGWRPPWTVRFSRRSMLSPRSIGV
ncbi:MAG: sigma-70 family RNA polymerase sigma factor [Armatimonadetes bacterium]|nr:sigma-70 family RNA polymerase sigma factor [Armatimonadota bacterium]MDW8154818.1 sigma-70 family RNA polymerase sigma factor [Armatimonadota bacterium]